VSHPDTLGVILAGGLARRMGGVDKVRIRIGRAAILERVLTRLRPQCARLVLNANTDAARFADVGVPVVADSVPDFPGPLAGILAGLDFAAAQTPAAAWVVSAPSDCPFLPRDLVPRLHQARHDADATLACAASDGRQHPVVALWPVALREDLRRALTEEGVRKVGEWSAHYKVGVAEWPAAPVDPFFNVNTPDDVAEAERLAALYPEA
jgi:molybdopterin-guanine dinucleotide biosynthesis protein A